MLLKGDRKFKNLAHPAPEIFIFAVCAAAAGLGLRQQRA
jgi:hypothetical protein